MGPASNSIQDLGDMDTDCSDADQAGDMDNELELGNGCPADRGTTSDEEEQAGEVLASAWMSSKRHVDCKCHAHARQFRCS